MASERGAQRDIQAARMRGDLPPEVDAQDSSKLVNPHVPSFMSTAPWYVSKGEGPTLAHQRLQKDGVVDQSMTALASLYVRGQKDASAVAGKFRPGACRNCGAVTHSERDCMERPRKAGAWKVGVQLAADEVVPGVASAGLKLGWDAKRDKYAGYDAAQQVQRAAQVYSDAEAMRSAHLRAEAERIEAERALARAERRASKKRARREAPGGGSGVEGGSGGAGGGGGGGGGGGDDGATNSDAGGETGDEADSFSGGSEAEDGSSGGGGGGAALRAPRTVEEEMKLGRSAEPGAGGQAQMTGWNMRSRENTAKYLLNLDPDSAFYDPKTRSMRENPFQGTGKDPRELLYAGDSAAMMK
jgi:pre-mRNA-processing factor SLU7